MSWIWRHLLCCCWDNHALLNFWSIEAHPCAGTHWKKNRKKSKNSNWCIFRHSKASGLYVFCASVHSRWLYAVYAGPSHPAVLFSKHVAHSPQMPSQSPHRFDGLVGTPGSSAVSKVDWALAVAFSLKGYETSFKRRFFPEDRMKTVINQGKNINEETTISFVATQSTPFWH